MSLEFPILTMHPEVLGPENNQIFGRLKAFPDFYLAGGTALALQIGHRKSVDFDLFSPKSISPRLLGEVEKAFGLRDISPLVNNSDELTVLVKGVKITFLFYPFPVFLGLKMYKGVPLLGVKEIAATKAYTIGRRGSYKDYVDLYFILKETHATLEEIIGLSQRKYQSSFHARLFLEQLIFLEDVQEEKIRFLGKGVGREELSAFFGGEIKKIKLWEV